MSKSEHDKSKAKRFALDFLSGGIAGAISKTTTAPLDRVKLLIQTQSENTKLNKPYNGALDCFMRCLKEEGLVSLWRGNVANVIRYFPTQAFNFSFKEKLNQIFNPHDPKKNPSQFFWGNILSGGIAGCSTITFVYPLDFARTRIGVDLGKNKDQRQFQGIGDCIRQVYNQNGITGIYKGFGVCLIGIFIYRGLYFGMYDSGKELFIPQDKKNDLLIKYLFAQLVVISSETFSYPTDTVKRKMMMQSARGSVLYKNSLDCITSIYSTKGIPGFYQGNSSNIIRSVGSSLCLVLYDELRKVSLQF